MSRCAIIIAGLLVLGLLQTVFAFEDELRFVEGLTEEGFPHLAETVLRRTLRDFPEAEKFAPELRIRILIAEKNFDEAQSAIAALDDPAPLWLFLGNTAYRARRFPAAEAAYKKYFETGADADDAALQAAFNYGELLETRGNRDAAEKIYEQVLTFPDLGKTARPVKVKLAHLLISGENPSAEDLARSQKLCEEVQLGGLDLWFGEAVVTWSRVMQLKGEWDETTAVLETQLELLKQLETALEKQGQPVSLVSPLAGARYLLGLCYEHRAENADDPDTEKQKALVQFYNVYAQYGDSEWGPQAQERAQELKSYFEGKGKTVKIDPGANRSKMEKSSFRVARRLFFEKQFAEAVPVYLAALNRYPEGDEAVTALRELTISYINLRDSLGAETVAAYLAERFAPRPAAADALLAAGKCALDKKQSELAGWIYDRYFESFPQHPRAPAVLYSLAALRRQTGDASGETDYLNRILQTYPESPYSARALGRLAWNAYGKEDYEAAAVQFEKYVDTETDPEKQMRARFALAESCRLSSHWKKALENFQILETSLNKTAESYGVSEETLAVGRPLLEKCLFYQGTCFAKLGEREAAVQTFDRFIGTFPESEFIPQVRFAKGSALMEMKKYSEALAAFADFDAADERRFLEPVLYFRGQAFYETGYYDESVQSLETLLNRWPKSAFFFEAKLLQGRAYAAAGRNADAVRVLSDVLNFTSDDLLMQRAGLELGRAQTDPAEKLASFQRVALLANPSDPEQAALIQQALYESLPLYLELNRPQDLLADSDRLENEFPDVGKNSELNSWREKAREQLTRNNQTAGDAN
ncbi:MAG: hypothetical protein PWQ29_1375 [Verrucomicrobiota bacterium]|nr:hypothetical protein [Verrucomicrobiota bacterium]